MTSWRRGFHLLAETSTLDPASGEAELAGILGVLAGYLDEKPPKRRFIEVWRQRPRQSLPLGARAFEQGRLSRPGGWVGPALLYPASESRSPEAPGKLPDGCARSPAPGPAGSTGWRAFVGRSLRWRSGWWAGLGGGRAAGRRRARIFFRSVDRGSPARRRPWRVSDCSAELNRFHAPVEGGLAPECRGGQVALPSSHVGEGSLALSPVPTGWLEERPRGLRRGGLSERGAVEVERQGGGFGLAASLPGAGWLHPFSLGLGLESPWPPSGGTYGFAFLRAVARWSGRDKQQEANPLRTTPIGRLKDCRQSSYFKKFNIAFAISSEIIGC